MLANKASSIFCDKKRKAAPSSLSLEVCFLSLSFDVISLRIVAKSDVVAGAKEAMDARPGETNIVLKKRKGFVKMAIREG